MQDLEETEGPISRLILWLPKIHTALVESTKISRKTIRIQQVVLLETALFIAAQIGQELKEVTLQRVEPT